MGTSWGERNNEKLHFSTNFTNFIGLETETHVRWARLAKLHLTLI